MFRLAWFALPIVVLGFGACGGSSSSSTKFDEDGSSGSGGTGGTGSNGGELPLEDVPDAYATAFCDVIQKCNPFFQALVPESECHDYFLNTLKNRGFDDILDAIDDGRATYDGRQMKACIDEVSARSCSELDNPDPESCKSATEGTVARGDACTTDVECEGDSICEFSGSCPGVCSAHLNAGDSCSGNDQCKEGLVCSDDTGRCVEPAQEGEDCEGGLAPVCDGDSLFCLGDDEETETPGTCRKLDEVFSAGPGDPCDFETGPLCESGSACVVTNLDPVTFECAEVVPRGEDCQFGAPNPCEAGSYCAGIDLGAADISGTCEAYAEPGDDCDPAALVMCGIGALCLDGRCVARKANGVSCDDSAECWSENCVDGGCAPQSACEN